MSQKLFDVSKALQAKAHRLIPGGSHTYAKGDDQYPVMAPGFIERGLGSHVWDVDGNEYIEYGMGNRAVTLGHAFPKVIEAVAAELGRGCNFTRPSPIEAECAERLLHVIAGAEMVKFCKDGSDATTGAVKLARAYTGRDRIAFCADHPFFAVDDWFIGSTAMNAGIPEATQRLSLTFRYNDINSARRLFEDHPGEIAGLILEPSRDIDPQDGFLHKLRDLCHKNGALFILDEMITGFRWHLGGGQALFDIVPDLSTFGKALSNGFSVSALVGKREFMRLGGLDHTDRPRVFMLSTTHGGETHALAAAMATIETYRTEPVVEHLYKMGARLRVGIEQVIGRHSMQPYVTLHGRDCCLVYGTRDLQGSPSQSFRSLFMQEVIRHGVIMPSLTVSYSHTPDDIDRTIDAVNAALAVYGKALNDGVDKYLIGRPSMVMQRRYNSPT